MTSVLSAVGLANSPIPDPAAYKNMMVEAANMLEVKQLIQTTLTKINDAIDEVRAAGLPQKNIDPLDALYTEAQNLLTANLGSAVTAGKLKDIETRLATIINEQKTVIETKNLADITELTKKIEKRVAEVKKNKLAPNTLIEEYDKLLSDAENAMKSAKDPKYPIRDKFYEMKKRLSNLEAKKNDLENKVFNWERFYRRILGIMMNGIAMISIATGILFGGIVMSNAFADEYFWGIRLFYFIYGAVLFPLSMIYGIYKKPYWVAGFFPMYKVGFVGAPGPVSTQPPQIPKAPTASEVTEMVKANVKRISQSGGGPPTLAERLFNYSVVKDDVVTLQQTANQNLLQRICYSELIALALVTLYYGATAETALKD